MVNATLKITVPSLQAMKRDKQKIVVLTSYDYTTTQLINAAGVDIVLVGDSLGMVKLGYSSTLPVTVEDMLYHTRIVAKANTRALLITDMPLEVFCAPRGIADAEETVSVCQLISLKSVLPTTMF